MPPKDKKEKPTGWDLNTLEGFIILLFIMAILGSIVPAILSSLTSGEFSFYGFKLSGFLDFFKSNINFFKSLGFAVAGGAAIGTFYFTKITDAIWRQEIAKLYPNESVVLAEEGLLKTQQKTKWEKIVELSESQNHSDWRLGIIEADILLDELLEKLRLPGDTMGDKLKAVEPSDFLTLDEAWEAHKARNMIAHEGSDFLLNQREVRRIISLYEAVFKEFSII